MHFKKKKKFDAINAFEFEDRDFQGYCSSCVLCVIPNSSSSCKGYSTSSSMLGCVSSLILAPTFALD
jgi:hypothetical protein